VAQPPVGLNVVSVPWSKRAGSSLLLPQAFPESPSRIAAWSWQTCAQVAQLRRTDACVGKHESPGERLPAPILFRDTVRNCI
jgi:hypothetical protein